MITMRDLLEARRLRDQKAFERQQFWAKFTSVMATIGGTILGAVGVGCVILLAKSVCQAVMLIGGW